MSSSHQFRHARSPVKAESLCDARAQFEAPGVELSALQIPDLVGASLGEAAVAYARLGMFVFPLRPRTKVPLYTGGFKLATTDVGVVKRWWQEHPDANIGLWPGASGLAVVDVDGDAGMASARALGLLEVETPIVTTSRGLHLYFRKPDGPPLGNLRPAPGLDVRSQSGYVLLPPSVHPQTRRAYEWAA